MRTLIQSLPRVTRLLPRTIGTLARTITDLSHLPSGFASRPTRIEPAFKNKDIRQIALKLATTDSNGGRSGELATELLIQASAEHGPFGEAAVLIATGSYFATDGNQVALDVLEEAVKIVASPTQDTPQQATTRAHLALTLYRVLSYLHATAAGKNSVLQGWVEGKLEQLLSQAQNTYIYSSGLPVIDALDIPQGGYALTKGNQRSGTNNVHSCVALSVHNPETKENLVAHAASYQTNKLKRLERHIESLGKSGNATARIIGNKDGRNPVFPEIAAMLKKANIPVISADLGDFSQPSSFVVQADGTLEEAVPRNLGSELFGHTIRTLAGKKKAWPIHENGVSIAPKVTPETIAKAKENWHYFKENPKKYDPGVIMYSDRCLRQSQLDEAKKLSDKPVTRGQGRT